jgi:hypothetical protein
MDRLGGLAGADYGQKCGGLVPSVGPYRPVPWEDMHQIVVGRVRLLLLYTNIGLFPGDRVVRRGQGPHFVPAGTENPTFSHRTRNIPHQYE